MYRRIVFVLPVVIVLLSLPKTYAQDSKYLPRAEPGGDYFLDIMSNDSNIRGYAESVTRAHVSVVPGNIQNGRLDNALGNLKYALDRFPNHPTALQQLSMVAQMIKDSTLAVSYFERAITLYPQYAITRAQYGLFLVSIGNIHDGVDKLRQSVEMDPKLAAGYAGLAHAYAKKGDLEHAREAAQKARDLGFRGKLPDGL